MKSLLVVVFSFFLGLTSLSAQQAIVAADANNYLYKGIHNELTVMLEGQSCDVVEAKADVGKLKNMQNCSYTYFVSAETDAQKVSVSLSHKGELVKEFSFVLKDIPSPKAHIGTKENRLGGKFSKADILSVKAIELYTKLPDLECEISKFSLLIEGKSYESNSAKITEEQKKALKNIPSGSHAIFENIYAQLPDGSMRKLNDIVIIVD